MLFALTAIGRKNWLFVDEGDAGQCSAIIYYLIESCSLRGLGLYSYLGEVLTRLPNMNNHQILSVMPGFWNKTQRQLEPAS